MEAFAWPVVFLIICLVAIIAFRRPVIKLLDRTQRLEIGPTGLKATSNGGQQVKADKPSSAEELMRAFDNVLLREQEEAIKAELAAHGLTEDADTVKVLIRYLAAAQLALCCERVYRQIWGSQITFLRLLSETPDGVVADLARITYESASTQYPDIYGEYTLEQWLGFLSSHRLISEGGDTLRITQLGEEFLSYVKRQGWTTNMLL